MVEMDDTEEEIARAVEDGLKVAKRIYGGKDQRYAPPPRPAEPMDRSGSRWLLPAAPMMYAVVYDPGMVDNPDIPSYQPHVHGRCDPPALIPLQMKEVELQVDCILESAIVSVAGKWRLHCITASRSCDCRFLLPIVDQGSILGVEFSVDKRSYASQVIHKEEDQNIEKIKKVDGGSFLKPGLFSLTVPQVRGGFDISLKVCWSQKLSYRDGDFSICVPFNFPDYLTTYAKIFSKREKIQLNVSSGTGKEIVLQRSSHILKERSRESGRLIFSYEAEVENWSRKDFYFSYSVYSLDLYGGVLLQAPLMNNSLLGDMFCAYLFPGNDENRKVFRKDVIFVVDVSASMQGKPLETVRRVLAAALLELTPEDSFNIIAFAEEIHSFSSSLEPATDDVIENATQWMSKNFVAEGGTSIMQALIKAMDFLSSSRLLSHIFLITDGSVEDERSICNTVRAHSAYRRDVPPRIFTFGIGSYCNHYFLRYLASMSRGQYDAALDPGLIEPQLQRLFSRASFPIVANVVIDCFDQRDAIEVYPSHMPDLCSGYPVVVTGVCHGKFPDSLKAKGYLADMSEITIELKISHVKDIPLEKVLAQQQIDVLTANTWLAESKQLEEKVSKLSIQSGIISEYTDMILIQTQQDAIKQANKSDYQKRGGGPQDNLIIQMKSMTPGFGNIIATSENVPAGFGQPKVPDNFAVYTKAVGCCNDLCDLCCCMCCIRCLSAMNDQFIIALTQLCTALSCFACFECCSEVCCDGSD